jgi:GNAT superfamily N-acetyltransferase
LESLRLNDIPGVEVDGRVVAYWPVWLAVHAEPLWVDPAHRTPGTIRVLVETLFQHLRDAGVGSAFVVLGHADQQVTLSAALRLGFQRVPGDLYVVDLRAAQPAPVEEPEAGVPHGRSRRAGDLARHPTLREPPRQ